MRRDAGTAFLLAQAEEELRRAILAERAGIKGAGMRRQRAEVEVDKWRRRVAVAAGAVEQNFGPGEAP